MPSPRKLEDLLQLAESLYRDLDLRAVAAWKAHAPGRRAIGYMPIYAPREVLHAAGVLPVGVMGGGDQVEIIRGDAYFQSYICQIPRSTLELALAGRLDALDGMIFPAICDVIRNLSGMWQLLFPGRMAFYLDLPQSGGEEVSTDFYEQELRRLAAQVAAISGTAATEDSLRASIRAYNRNAEAVRRLDQARSERPWKLPADEVYLMLRAGNLLPVDEHTALLEAYLAEALDSDRPERDQSRVVVTGAFCEQPPLDLIRTLERAGCYVVADDMVLGARFLKVPVGDSGDPFRSLAEAYVRDGVSTASRYEREARKGAWLVELARERRADGVIFAAPSFCDPALLEQPMLVRALDEAGVPHTAFKYSEGLGQFQVIREQAGTFADSIRLWGPGSDPAPGGARP